MTGSNTYLVLISVNNKRVSSVHKMDIDAASDSDQSLHDFNPVSIYVDTFDYTYLNPGSCIAAVYNGELQKLKELIQKGKSVNASDNRGYTALHAAVEKENFQILSFLLTVPDIILDHRTFYGETALFKAMSCSSSIFASTLINSGADITIPNLEQVSPLHRAVHKFHDVAEMLLRIGASVNAVDYDMCTPLHEAVIYGDSKMVSLLLEHNADASAVEKDGMTPFMIALLQNNDVEIQKVLFNQETNFNMVGTGKYDGLSPLLLAMMNKSPLAPLMIDKGADINYSNCSDTSLSLCVQYEDPDLFKKILEKFDYRAMDRTIEPIISKISMTELPTKCYLKYLKIIFSSDQVSDCIFHYANSTCNFFNFFVSGFHKRGLTEEELFPFVKKLVSVIPEVNSDVLQVIYDRYGHCKTFELFLQGNVRIILKHIQNNRLTVPWFLSNFEIIPRKYLGDHLNFENGKLNVEICKNALELLRICTPHYKLKEKYLLALQAEKELLSSSPLKAVVFLCTLKETFEKFVVPSLCELSRDAARLLIITHYNVQDTHTFYAALRTMDIKHILKDIICYKVAVNN